MVRSRGRDCRFQRATSVSVRPQTSGRIGMLSRPLRSRRVALAPWIAPVLLAEYVHNAGVRIRRQFRGHTRHGGNAASIVRACIEACWNGRTFPASPGHFDMFWTRDLSFSVPSLVRLGYRDRVRESLSYALDVWTSRDHHITTTIHYFDRPGDVYEYGVDSLPLFMAALRVAGASDLVERHRPWPA